MDPMTVDPEPENKPEQQPETPPAEAPPAENLSPNQKIARALETPAKE